MMIAAFAPGDEVTGEILGAFGKYVYSIQSVVFFSFGDNLSADGCTASSIRSDGRHLFIYLAPKDSLLQSIFKILRSLPPWRLYPDKAVFHL